MTDARTAEEHVSRIISEQAGQSGDVAQETESGTDKVQDVAGETGGDVADSGQTQETPAPSGVDLTQYDEFREWQASAGKKQTELEKRLADQDAEIERLKAKSNPELSAEDRDAQRKSLVDKYNGIKASLEKATGEERDNLVISQHGLRASILDMDVRIAADRYGADPNSPVIQEAIQNQQLVTPRDVEFYALLSAFQDPSLNQAKSADLAKREEDLAKREAEVDGIVEERVAQKFRELGMDNVPGVKVVGKAPSKTPNQQAYDDLLSSGKTGIDYAKQAIAMKLEDPTIQG